MTLMRDVPAVWPLPRRQRFSEVLRVFGERSFQTDGDLWAVAFGAGGSLWSVEDPGVLRQWDANSGQQLGWAFLSDLATVWRFSPDGRLVAAGSDEVVVWDVATSHLVLTLPSASWVTTLAFGPDARFLATGHDDGVTRVWDLSSHEVVREHAGHCGPVSAIAWRADGALATAGEDRVIHLWDREGRPLSRLVGHTDRITGLAFDPAGHRLASAGWDTTVRLWDIATGEPIILLNAHAQQVTALAFHPDGSRLASADSAHAVYLWDAKTHLILRRWEEHRAEVAALVFDGAGQRLVSAGADRILHVWDTSCGARLSSRGEAALDRACLALTPNGGQLASTCAGNGLRVWDTATGQTRIEQIGSHSWHVLAGSGDGAWLAAGGTDSSVRLYDAATGQLHATFTGQDGPATAVAFTPDSKRLAAASATDGMVWLYRVPDGEPCLVIPEAADNCMIEALAFHPHGHLLAVGGIDWLATGGSDGAVCLWNVEQPGPIVTLDGGTTSLSFHPDGHWLAGASLCEKVWVWDLKTLKRIGRLAGHTAGVTCVAFSPDGRWLASGGDDRTVRLWHVFSWELAAVRELPTQIKALAFAPDGRYLYTANGNTTSYQLDVTRLAQCKPQPVTELDAAPLPLAMPGFHATLR